MSESFLNIITSQEATNKGINLDDKSKHAIYFAIQRLSTLSNASSGKLFSERTENPDIEAISKPEYLRILRGLLVDSLVTQLFYLDFDPGSNALSLLPCFIANPGKEPVFLTKLYNAVVEYSVREIEKLLQYYKPATPQQLQDDFTTDANQKPKGERAQPKQSLVKIFEAVDLDRFEIFPPSAAVSSIVSEITETLLSSNKIAELTNFGHIPIHDDELVIRFQLAEDVLNQKLLPQYKKKANCRRHFEQITLEEAAYYLDRIVPYKAAFSRRRAEVIARDNKPRLENENDFYPGMLAVETLKVVAEFADQKFQKQWEEKNRLKHADIKKTLLDLSQTWNKLLLFVKEEEVASIPRELWTMLIEDKELVHCEWQLPEGSEHVFMKADARVIRKLIEGMYQEIPEARWQILALKNAIEKAETRLKGLFDDKELVKKYGRLLREAYTDHVPWYYKILFLMSLKFIQDLAFPIAKEKISEEQASRERRNSQKVLLREAEKQRDRELKINQIRRIENKNRIIEKLDMFYMVQHVMPSVTQVKESLNNMADSVFDKTLSEENFQVLTGSSKNADGSILLYPIDQDWPVTATRLLNAIEGWLVVMNKRELNDSEKASIERAKRVKSHLERKKNARIPKVVEDPFKKLEEAIKAMSVTKRRPSLGAVWPARNAPGQLGFTGHHSGLWHRIYRRNCC